MGRIHCLGISQVLDFVSPVLLFEGEIFFAEPLDFPLSLCHDGSHGQLNLLAARFGCLELLGNVSHRLVELSIAFMDDSKLFLVRLSEEIVGVLFKTFQLSKLGFEPRKQQQSISRADIIVRRGSTASSSELGSRGSAMLHITPRQLAIANLRINGRGRVTKRAGKWTEEKDQAGARGNHLRALKVFLKGSDGCLMLGGWGRNVW